MTKILYTYRKHRQFYLDCYPDVITWIITYLANVGKIVDGVVGLFSVGFLQVRLEEFFLDWKQEYIKNKSRK